MYYVTTVTVKSNQVDLTYKKVDLYDISWDNMGEERAMCMDVVTSEKFANTLAEMTNSLREHHPQWDELLGWLDGGSEDAFLHSIEWSVDIGQLVLET